jgi:hypothetical protein
MKGRILSFKVENPNLGTDCFGKKQFNGFKNRNSKEFSLNRLADLPFLQRFEIDEPRSLRNSPLPFSSPKKSKNSIITPKNDSIFNKEMIESRLVKLDQIRKKMNLKIVEMKKEDKIFNVPPRFPPPTIRKVSPEKFLESISYSKADLNFPSKFIPTDRNTNRILEENMFKPVFRSQVYTKNSPKLIFTNPII